MSLPTLLRPSGARARRMPVLVGVVLAATLGLAACEKPTPAVTLQSGTRSVHSEATLYVRDGKQVRGQKSVTVLRTYPGETVGIDVDRAIADAGWQVHITTGSNGSNVFNSGLLKVHHYSFVVGAESTDVVISQTGSDGTPTGLWAFSVQPTLQ